MSVINVTSYLMWRDTWCVWFSFPTKSHVLLLLDERILIWRPEIEYLIFANLWNFSYCWCQKKKPIRRRFIICTLKLSLIWSVIKLSIDLMRPISSGKIKKVTLNANERKCCRRVVQNTILLITIAEGMLYVNYSIM